MSGGGEEQEQIVAQQATTTIANYDNQLLSREALKTNQQAGADHHQARNRNINNATNCDNDNQESAAARYRPQKYCSVCGDKAIACNFNAVTCESCKAFFRRNAFKEQRLKCLFDNRCVIDRVTRRFCSKCRLLKCFQIGMKREWILTDEQKLIKRVKIMENKNSKMQQQQKQSQVSTSCTIESTSTTKSQVSEDDASSSPSICYMRTNAGEVQAEGDRRKKIRISSASPERVDVATSCPDMADLMTSGRLLHYCTLAHQCQFCSLRLSTTNYQHVQGSAGQSPEVAQSPYLHYHHQPPPPPPPAASRHAPAYQEQQQQQHYHEQHYHYQQQSVGGQLRAPIVHHQPAASDMTSSCCRQAPETRDTSCYCGGGGGGGAPANARLVRYEPPPPPTQLHVMESSYAQTSAGSDANNNNNSQDQCSSNPFVMALEAQRMSFGAEPQQILQQPIVQPAVRSPPAECTSGEEKVNEKVCVKESPTPVEYISCQGELFAKPALDQLEVRARAERIDFSETERQLVYEMIDATKFMFDPTSHDRSFHEASLDSFVYFCDAALRRLIKTVKQIRAFRILSMDDQIMLLKTACFKILLLRSCLHYNDEIEGWRDKFGRTMPLSMLKTAKSLVYEKHKEILRKLVWPLRQDRMILGFASLVLLFDPVTNLKHSNSVGLDNLIYLCVLRKYLCATQPEPLAKYERLVDVLQVINACNEEYNVFFSKNFQPEQITPLLIEIFDISMNTNSV